MDGLEAVRQSASLEEVHACRAGAAELVDALIAARFLTSDRVKEGQAVVTAPTTAGCQ
jgi:hypothetical protein